MASDDLIETPPTGHGRARGLVSSRKSGRRVEATTYAPPEDLAHVVLAFWAGRWDLRGQAPHVTELLSDPCTNVVFEIGEAGVESRLVGVWTKLWRRTLEGRGRVRGVKLKPGASRAFVREPAHTFADRIVPLDDVMPGAAGVERAAIEPEDDDAGFAAVTDWLRARLQFEEDVSLAIALVDRIAADLEITSVDRLSEVAGMSARAVQRHFRDWVGAPPKWVIRRYRLQEVALRIERGEPQSFAALAADLGYTDQAHLARDFKSATGRSPSAFAALMRA